MQKEAAISFIQEVAGFDVQKAMNMTKILPSSRIDVLNDPEVVATYTLAPTLVEQGKYNAYFVNTPYVVQPVFADATTELWNKEYTPEQAHEAAVKGVEDLIVEYLDDLMVAIASARYAGGRLFRPPRIVAVHDARPRSPAAAGGRSA